VKVVFTNRAADDLEDLGAKPSGARNVRAAILKTLAGLSKFPRSGRMQTVTGVRKIGVRRYPYLIYYVVEDTAKVIAVLTIQHAASERDYTDR
jgi:toxin ParE1/3/4